MKKLYIDVRGFSDEKKKRVQGALFELGINWPERGAYLYLNAGSYTNVYTNGKASDRLLYGSGDMSEHQRKYAITYPALMRKAGMDESDPDAESKFKIGDKVRVVKQGMFSPCISVGDIGEVVKVNENGRLFIRFVSREQTCMDYNDWIELAGNEVAPKQVGGFPVEVLLTDNLQETIESYMYLLNSIEDPDARSVIKSQLTDLTDLQYSQYAEIIK